MSRLLRVKACQSTLAKVQAKTILSARIDFYLTQLKFIKIWSEHFYPTQMFEMCETSFAINLLLMISNSLGHSCGCSYFVLTGKVSNQLDSCC
jgi:hypothetical protein